MTATETPLRSILITGASSGLGEALAVAYAATGRMLALTGRNARRLDDVARHCQHLGAEVEAVTLDVSNRAAMTEWIGEVDRRWHIDLAIANAGVSGGPGPTEQEDPQQARRIFDINLMGTLNTVEPLLAAMGARGRGQIALMSSLAAYRGMPGAPAYSASKAAVKHYGEALRPQMAKLGVKVNVICPGFVRTAMTDRNPFPMPMLMEPDAAARRIVEALAANRPRIAFPLPMAFASWLLGLLPVGVGDALLEKMPEKPEEPELRK